MNVTFHDQAGRDSDDGSSRGVTPLGRDHPLESLEPERVLVQAGNQRQRRAARLQKRLTPPQSDFLERLQAIGDEGGAKHHKPPDAAVASRTSTWSV